MRIGRHKFRISCYKGFLRSLGELECITLEGKYYQEYVQLYGRLYEHSSYLYNKRDVVVGTTYIEVPTKMFIQSINIEPTILNLREG